MDENILFVDDDVNILSSYERQFRGKYNMETALGGKKALAEITSKGPYAVIISDLRMPEMDGVQFFAKVKEGYPDTIRVMLTGQADLEAAISAVNEGNIFRFLTKPCPINILTSALNASLAQYQLVTAERVLLEKTLRGSVKVLTDVLSLVNPEAFGRSARIKRYAHGIAVQMGIPDVWRIEIATMLSQIGCIIFPEKILKKIYQGEKLSGEEAQLYKRHPGIASDLLINIPRLQEVSEIIAYQEKLFNGSGTPSDNRRGEEIPLGARILKVALDFDLLEGIGMKKSEAFAKMELRSGWYDPQVLGALDKVLERREKYEVRELKIEDIRENMLAAEDIRTSKGILLIPRGQELEKLMIIRLRHFIKTEEISGTFRILIPIKGGY
ncbi:MAG: HD domain-containing phosphohydrolase [bacterium]